MSTFPRVRIFNESDDKPFPTHIEIDGKRINGVQSIRYSYDVDEVPIVDIEVASLMDSGIDVYNPELRIKFHPQTVHEAMAVLGISGMYDENGSPAFLFDDGK